VALDPPIGASGLDWGLVPRWSPFRGRPFQGMAGDYQEIARLTRLFFSGAF
jgi:hypothetical protein